MQLTGMFLLDWDDGYGNTDAALDIDDTGAVLTWFGNNGEEVRQREVSFAEANRILLTPGVALGQLRTS